MADKEINVSGKTKTKNSTYTYIEGNIHLKDSKNVETCGTVKIEKPEK